MGNKVRHEGDEVRIKVIWPDLLLTSLQEICLFWTASDIVDSHMSG